MNNAALFVDVGNLYYSVSKRFDQRKLDYNKLMDKASQLCPIERAFAYGSQSNNEAVGFISCLDSFGYETKYKNHKLSEDKTKILKRVDWDVGIAVDIVRMSDRVNTIILGSNDSDLIPIIEWVKAKGLRCFILACNVPYVMRQACDRSFEITDDLLEETQTVAQVSEE